MCAGNASRQQHHAQQEAERDYWRQQDAVNAEAKRKQDELNRIAAERAATAATQEARQRELEGQLSDDIRRQNAQAADARDRQQAAIAEMNRRQEENLAKVRATGQALRGSMMVLSQQGGTQAPTAQADKSKKQATGARSTTASLRMGATGSGSGSGANLSV
jgi:hypothetical protein